MMFYSSSRWTKKAALAMAIAGTATLGVSHRPVAAATFDTPAFHLALSRAEPGVNDTINASPSTLKLWFTESVQAAGTSLRLTGPAGKAVALGEITVDAAPKSPAVAKVSETLAAGTYVVSWRTMAADGHPTNGKFSFTIRPAEKR